MHIYPDIMVAKRGAMLAAKQGLLATANKFIGSKLLEEKIERAGAERTDLRIMRHLKKTVKLAKKIGLAGRLEDKHSMAYLKSNKRWSPDIRSERLRSGKLPNYGIEDNLLEMHHLYMKLADHHAKLAGGNGGTSGKIERIIAEAYYSKAISTSRKLIAQYGKHLSAACDELKAVAEKYPRTHPVYETALGYLMGVYDSITYYGVEMNELEGTIGNFKGSRGLSLLKESVMKEYADGLQEKAYGIFGLPFVHYHFSGPKYQTVFASGALHGN